MGRAPRVLGPLPLVFSVYYLVEQIFVPFSIVISLVSLYAVVTKFRKAMLTAVGNPWRCIHVTDNAQLFQQVLIYEATHKGRYVVSRARKLSPAGVSRLW